MTTVAFVRTDPATRHVVAQTRIPAATLGPGLAVSVSRQTDAVAP